MPSSGPLGLWRRIFQSSTLKSPTATSTQVNHRLGSLTLLRPSSVTRHRLVGSPPEGDSPLVPGLGLGADMVVPDDGRYRPGPWPRLLPRTWASLQGMTLRPSPPRLVDATAAFVRFRAPTAVMTCRSPPGPEDPSSVPVPSSAFLTPSTVCSSDKLPALFRPVPLLGFSLQSFAPCGQSYAFRRRDPLAVPRYRCPPL
jgi:hypothetical protein